MHNMNIDNNIVLCNVKIGRMVIINISVTCCTT